MSSADVAARARGESPTLGAAEFGLLAVLSFAWGTSFMFSKIAVEALPPFTLIALRTLIASSILLCFLAARRRLPRLSRRDIAAFVLVGLMSNAAPLCFISNSVMYVDSSVTATALALVPVITVIFGMFRGVYPTVRALFGVFVGLAGIVVLFGPDAFASFGDDMRGLLAAMGAAITFSASLFVVSLVRHHNSVTVATYSLTSAAIWTLTAALLFDGVPQTLPSPGILGALLVLALWNTAAGSLLLFITVSRAGPAVTSYNNYLVPAVAVGCGTIFLGEPLTLQSAAGVILVLTGVAISTIRPRSASAVPPPG